MSCSWGNILNLKHDSTANVSQFFMLKTSWMWTIRKEILRTRFHRDLKMNFENELYEHQGAGRSLCNLCFSMWTSLWGQHGIKQWFGGSSLYSAGILGSCETFSNDLGTSSGHVTAEGPFSTLKVTPFIFHFDFIMSHCYLWIITVGSAFHSEVRIRS